jgi:exopolysaccharide production protein ExoZ
MPMPAKPAYAERAQPVPGQIRSVQSLRAIASLFVVLFHSTVLWHDRFAPGVVPWENGNSGVDLFFVISGFIMVVSSRRLLGQVNGWRQFMVLRLIRITPMYWLATAAKLAAIVAVPALALHTHPTEWNTVASFLFLPARDAVGAIRPVLDAGWTLSFEMLFYLVFASALFLGIAPLRVVGPAMAVLAILSVARATNGPAITTLASPIVLEFVFGALIGQAFIDGSLSRLSSPWMIALSVAGLLCLTFVPADGVWYRMAIWGLAAAAALAGCVLAERWLDPLLPRLFERIGEASYSLYLTHGFVLPVAGLVIAKTGLAGNTLGAVLIVSCLLASIIIGMVVYRFIEAPITAWLRGLAGDRRRTNLAAPQTAI